MAVERWILTQKGLSDALNTLRKLMAQLRTVKNSAKLRELSHVGALLPNETRWNGKFHMVKRFFKIEEHLRSIISLDSYLLNAQERRSLQSALPHFQNFESVTVNLQKKGLSFADARYLLDQICEDYPSMSYYLEAESSIVNDKIFESAVVKISNRNEAGLTREERISATKLLTDSIISNDTSTETNEDSNLSYFEKLQAKRRRLSTSATKFIDCSFIAATSSSVERSFSAARWILTSLRKTMSPILFESILFLRMNRDLWDLKLVAAAMKLAPSERYVEFDEDYFYSLDSCETHES